MGKSKAIFLDRDGVINKIVYRKGIPCSPRMLEEFKLAEDIENVIDTLRLHGYLIFVVTNQPDVARGTMDSKDLEKIHSYMSGKLKFDDIFVCKHDDVDKCSGRKPNIGFITCARLSYDIDLSKSFIVGDTWRDSELAENCGCRCILVDAPYNKDVKCWKRVNNISEIIKIIMEE